MKNLMLFLALSLTCSIASFGQFHNYGPILKSNKGVYKVPPKINRYKRPWVFKPIAVCPDLNVEINIAEYHVYDSNIRKILIQASVKNIGTGNFILGQGQFATLHLYKVQKYAQHRVELVRTKFNKLKMGDARTIFFIDKFNANQLSKPIYKAIVTYTRKPAAALLDYTKECNMSNNSASLTP